MKQTTIQNFDPNDLHKFLMQSARENFDENREDFNAGMAMLMALVKKYFCDDFDIAIRDNNGWISVDDKSLKQYANKEILIYTACGNIKKAIYSVDNSPYIDDDGTEYQYSHWFSDEFGDFMWEFDEIKYWQPLPQPPNKRTSLCKKPTNLEPI